MESTLTIDSDLPAASLDAAGAVSGVGEPLGVMDPLANHALVIHDAAPAQSIALSPGIVLIAFPASISAENLGRLIVRPETGSLQPPLSWHRLPAVAASEARLLLLARVQDGLAPGATLRLTDADGRSTVVLLAPGSGLEMLVTRGDTAGVVGLLRFIAAKATGLLRHSEDTGLAETCWQLAASVRSPDRVARPAALCGPDLMLWTLPGPIAAGGGASYAINRRRLRRLPLSGGTVLLPDRRFGEAFLLPPGSEGPIFLATTRRRPPSLGVLGKRRDPDSRALLRSGLAALADRAATDPDSRRLLRDLQLLAPTEKPHHYAQVSRPFGAGLDMAIDDHAGGLFIRGWLRDPLGIVARLLLRGPHGDLPLPLSLLQRFHRPDLVEKYAASPHGGIGSRAGFAAHLAEAAAKPVAQWSLRVELTTGDPIALIAPPGILHPQNARDAVLGAITPAECTPVLMGEAVAPAVERLHRVIMAGRQPAETIAIGPPPRRPDVSIVVPLYRNLRFLRHQFAAFARDRTLRDVELIYVLDSPEQRAEVEHLLRGLHGIYGSPLLLVVQAGNYGYASACNAGAAVARAPLLLMLNSDVVPAARGWLKPLAAALARQPSVAAAGPKLLFEDGSLQHAGLTFGLGTDGEWYNDHFHKGFPRFFPAAQLARRVPAVTGAALLVRRAAFEAVGGFTTDYVIGDYEDSDLCLKLRADGGEIAYAPGAELYHFERQSIRDHAGYARTLAAVYNRRLHHRRWATAIARLMAREERRAARGR